jgi:NAD(P)-dependent dehydrogenase (short-subunit alcohol dehydrogenase family)
MTRSVVITGAASGIGEQIARVAAAEGWRVGLLDRADAVETIAAGIGGVALRASVTDESEVGAALDRFGSLDALVNCAGIVRFGPLLDVTLADWQAVVEVNLTGTFVVARAAAARMAPGGAIVNIGSMNGVAPGPGAGAYGATKAAVHLLTQQMALEWAPALRVNAIAPGLIDAGMAAPIYADAATRAAREDKVPLQRLGTPDDIARVAMWLLSEGAAYVTGQTILVDGGVTMAMIANLPRPAAVEAPAS